MAQFEKAINKVYKLEFSDPFNALHKNKNESDMTFMGIYRTAHPTWIVWSIVDKYTAMFDNPRAASHAAYNDLQLREMVGKFYKSEFWDKMRLDEIKSQHIAEEMFVFGVNAGIKMAVKAAQKVIGVTDDGKLGPITLGKLNEYAEDKFNVEYDIIEIAYYEELIKKNENYKIYLKGWKNRAEAI